MPRAADKKQIPMNFISLHPAFRDTLEPFNSASEGFVMDFDGIEGVVEGTKSALEIIKLLRGLSVSSEVDQKLVELLGQLRTAHEGAISAYAAQASLLKQVNDYEQKLMSYETWATEKERYALHSPWEGGFVFALKQSAALNTPPEPPHYLCQTCYENRCKSVLQRRKQEGSPRESEHFCPKCSAVLPEPHGTFEIGYAAG